VSGDVVAKYCQRCIYGIGKHADDCTSVGAQMGFLVKPPDQLKTVPEDKPVVVD
jgi:hypothetical protein